MNSVKQKVILNRVEAALATPAKESSFSVYELLILLRTLTNHQPALAEQLFSHFWAPTANPTPAHPLPAYQLCQGIAIRECSRNQSFPGLSAAELKSVLQHRQQLQRLLDPETSGVITLSERDIPQNELLGLQTLWIQNVELLSTLATAAGLDTEEISLQLEVLTHETNHQFWSVDSGTYLLHPNNNSQVNSPQPLQYLPLWAKIPDQDQAEDMLIQLRTTTPPWTKPEDTSWVSATTLLIYEGLQHYEMHKAAQELKSYLYRHCYNKQDNWLHACISLAFAASSPA
ncbi:MAG: hypothetical protein AAFN81_23910 [Bacteroidota bacterium]